MLTNPALATFPPETCGRLLDDPRVHQLQDNVNVAKMLRTIMPISGELRSPPGVGPLQQGDGIAALRPLPGDSKLWVVLRGGPFSSQAASRMASSRRTGISWEGCRAPHSSLRLRVSVAVPMWEEAHPFLTMSVIDLVDVKQSAPERAAPEQTARSLRPVRWERPAGSEPPRCRLRL